MKINDEKTQILSVSSGQYETEANLLSRSGGLISSSSDLKMLGFIFSKSPSVQPQIDHLIRKANKRYFLLLHYKRAGILNDRLKEVYCAMTRSLLEYSANVFHSQLNISQSKQLENIQKRCLKAIYGYDLKYSELLRISGLNTLQDRRIESFRKFTIKTSKNPKYSHWFPKREVQRPTRLYEPYQEETAVGSTSRLHNSPIFAMRRIMNDSDNTPPENLAEFFHIPI